MIELAYLKEKDKVKQIIFKILHVLESEYVKDKRYEDDGDYVVILEKEKDFEELKYKAYTNSLILCNNDYAISIIIPIELIPQNLKEYMID